MKKVFTFLSLFIVSSVFLYSQKIAYPMMSNDNYAYVDKDSTVIITFYKTPTEIYFSDIPIEDSNAELEIIDAKTAKTISTFRVQVSCEKEMSKSVVKFNKEKKIISIDSVCYDMFTGEILNESFEDNSDLTFIDFPYLSSSIQLYSVWTIDYKWIEIDCGCEYTIIYAYNADTTQILNIIPSRFTGVNSIQSKDMNSGKMSFLGYEELSMFFYKKIPAMLYATYDINKDEFKRYFLDVKSKITIYPTENLDVALLLGDTITNSHRRAYYYDLESKKITDSIYFPNDEITSTNLSSFKYCLFNTEDSVTIMYNIQENKEVARFKNDGINYNKISDDGRYVYSYQVIKNKIETYKLYYYDVNDGNKNFKDISNIPVDYYLTDVISSDMKYVLLDNKNSDYSSSKIAAWSVEQEKIVAYTETKETTEGIKTFKEFYFHPFSATYYESVYTQYIYFMLNYSGVVNLLNGKYCAYEDGIAIDKNKNKMLIDKCAGLYYMTDICEESISSVEDEFYNKVSSLQLYPNPAVNYISIKNPLQGSCFVNVISENGNTISSKEYFSDGNNLKLETQSLPNGVYIIEVLSQKEKFTGRFNIVR